MEHVSTQHRCVTGRFRDREPETVVVAPKRPSDSRSFKPAPGRLQPGLPGRPVESIASPELACQHSHVVAASPLACERDPGLEARCVPVLDAVPADFLTRCL